jgi:hypothetical protein
MPSFARDIRPLFRDKDVEEMRFAFDLSNYDDVKSNAVGIHARLADGSMPATMRGVANKLPCSGNGWTKALHPEPWRPASRLEPPHCAVSMLL